MLKIVNITDFILQIYILLYVWKLERCIQKCGHTVNIITDLIERYFPQPSIKLRRCKNTIQRIHYSKGARRNIRKKEGIIEERIKKEDLKHHPDDIANDKEFGLKGTLW